MRQKYNNNVFPKLNGTLFWFFVSTIFYTYLGYPLLISILAHLFPKKKNYRQSYPFTSLIIAAYNEEKIIEKKIQNCLLLDYPKNLLQIIVVADGSNDSTVDIVRTYKAQNIQLLYQSERRGKMAAINRALPYASGEIILFSDANNFYLPNTLEKLVLPFSDPKVGAVCGAKMIDRGDGLLGDSEGLYWKYESLIKTFEDRFGSCTSATGEILACRTSLFQPPPDHIINDDFYIIMQILCQDYQIAYVNDAKSYERISGSAEQEIKRRTRIIAGRYQAMSMAKKILPFNRPTIIWQIVSHKFLRPLVPFFMIGAAITNLIAVLTPPRIANQKKKICLIGKPYNQVILGLQAFFYLLAWIGRLIKEQDQSNPIKRILYLPTFLVNSNFAALRGFVIYLQGKHSPLWERVPRR
jgi:cellulose synthase/poly-beta-1,6-N-acetylglucosamine synthase-like glycosyltransferase